MTQDETTLAIEAGPAGWVNRQTAWFARHWLIVVNIFTGIFVGLPYLAPVLMRYGYNAPAHVIYTAYKLTCHQLPSRSYFILGHQAAFCHRDTAIWGAFFIGGLVFRPGRNRLRALPFHWWILALIPIGLDGGTQLVGPLYEALPAWALTGFAVAVWLGLTAVMVSKGVKHRQYYLFVICFPLAMYYVQITGTRLSNWQLRSITGAIFGLANAWLMYPMFEEAFGDLRREMDIKRGHSPAV